MQSSNASPRRDENPNTLASKSKRQIGQVVKGGRTKASLDEQELTRSTKPVTPRPAQLISSSDHGVYRVESGAPYKQFCVKEIIEVEVSFQPVDDGSDNDEQQMRAQFNVQLSSSRRRHWIPQGTFTKEHETALRNFIERLQMKLRAAQDELGRVLEMGPINEVRYDEREPVKILPSLHKNADKKAKSSGGKNVRLVVSKKPIQMESDTDDTLDLDELPAALRFSSDHEIDLKFDELEDENEDDDNDNVHDSSSDLPTPEECIGDLFMTQAQGSVVQAESPLEASPKRTSAVKASPMKGSPAKLSPQRRNPSKVAPLGDLKIATPKNLPISITKEPAAQQSSSKDVSTAAQPQNNNGRKRRTASEKVVGGKREKESLEAKKARLVDAIKEAREQAGESPENDGTKEGNACIIM